MAPPSSETSTGFKVPSVKLLLANLRSLKTDRPKRHKTEPRNFVKSAITIDIIPSDSVRYNDLNKQVFFKNEKRKSFRNTSKSSSTDTDYHFYKNNESSTGTPPPFSYDNYWLDQYTSLSERVLIWLDLAIQNQKNFNNCDLKKRLVTARCPLVERNKVTHSFVENKNVERKEKSETERNQVVTSRMECDHVEAAHDDTKPKTRITTAKRQLHIFIPNLPKKCSDSGSFLSSKSNSLLLHNNNNNVITSNK